MKVTIKEEKKSNYLGDDCHNCFFWIRNMCTMIPCNCKYSKDIKMKDPIKIKQGQSAKNQGNDFERRVRINLENKGWIVDKWNNQIWDNKLSPARHKFQQNGIPFTIGVGFPDFICFRQHKDYWYLDNDDGYLYGIVGVECKINGMLSKEEKEKCKWLLNKGVFSSIKIAKKTKIKNKIVIMYHDFVEKYEK